MNKKQKVDEAREVVGFEKILLKLNPDNKRDLLKYCRHVLICQDLGIPHISPEGWEKLTNTIVNA